MVMVFLLFESIWVSLARSRSCQKFQILKCLILKSKDLFLMQNVPGIQWCHLFFFCTWSRTPKNHVLLHDVTIRCHVVKINLAFGGQKSMYRFEILCCGGCWLGVYHITRFLKIFKILDFMVIFIHSKKRCFLKFWGSKSWNIKNPR